jgi:deoxyribonuclease V
MIACLDVDYRGTRAIAAGIVFRDWGDAHGMEERLVSIPDVKPYRSGQFFVRELPCLMAILRVLPPVRIVVVDGYVWLEGTDKLGLGAHLHESLAGCVAVIGVAKTPYFGVERVREIRRGKSTSPLFISAVGMSVEQAADHICSMHGPYRIPTLLKRVDLLSRSELSGLTLRESGDG